MQTTELSLTFEGADPLPQETTERIKQICLDRLQLSLDQADALCKNQGRLRLTSSEEPAQLQAIINELARLGVLVESRGSRTPRSPVVLNHQPSRVHKRPRRRRTVYPSLDDSARKRQTTPRATASRHIALTVATIILVMGIGSAGGLFWTLSPSLHRLEPQDFYQAAIAPAPAPSDIPQSRTFLGTARLAPLSLTVQASQRGDTISVRLFSEGTDPSLTSNSRIERIESDPTFLTPHGDKTLEGQAPAVFTVISAGESHQVSGVFEIALRTSSTGTPRDVSIQLKLPVEADSAEAAAVDTLRDQLKVFTSSTLVELFAS